jgi:hypothetical protein
VAKDDNSGYQASIESAMLALSRDFITVDDDISATLGRVTTSAVDLISGVDFADVMLIQGDHFCSIAPTDARLTSLDAVQMQHKEGPCLQAAVADSIIRCSDLQRDERWPTFAAAALEADIRGAMSFQLFTNRGGAGALNLFGRQANAVDSEGEAIGAMLATHAAGVMMALNRQHEFESALASRDLIGQAKGIIMNQFSVDAVRAFEMMTKQSQNTNTPVRVVAPQIIDGFRNGL